MQPEPFELQLQLLPSPLLLGQVSPLQLLPLGLVLSLQPLPLDPVSPLPVDLVPPLAPPAPPAPLAPLAPSDVQLQLLGLPRQQRDLLSSQLVAVYMQL
jgi:hypothetical protein